MKKLKPIIWIFLFTVIIATASFGAYYFSKNSSFSSTTFTIKNPTYDIDKDMENVFKQLENERKEANKIEGIDTDEKIIAITFDDLANVKTMEHIIDLLDKYSIKATFFVPAIKGAESSHILKRAVNHGHEIGNYTMSGLRHMESLSEEELVEDFVHSRSILKGVLGKVPKLLKANETKYTKGLLEVANATGVDSVVKSNYILNYASFLSYETALNYVNKLDKGSILSIKVKGYLGEGEYKPSAKKEEKPAIDKKDFKPNKKTENQLSEEERLLQVVEWVLKAIKETDYKVELVKDLPNFNKKGSSKKQYVYVNTLSEYKDNIKLEDEYNNLSTNDGEGNKDEEHNSTTAFNNVNVKLSDCNKLRENNEGKNAKTVKNVYTTQPAVSYIFRNIGNEQTVNNVLEVLKEIDAKATFFVTGKEILLYPNTIQNIVDRGHILANGGLNASSNNPSTLSYEEISYEIEMGEIILKGFLKDEYSLANKQYMPLYADTGGFVLEAASALGYENVIIYNRSPITSAYRDMDSATIIDNYYKNTISLHRGDIVYFRLDYLTQEGAMEQLILDTAQKFIKKSNYDIVSVDELINSNLVYRPFPRGTGPSSDLIRWTYNYSESTIENLILNNYIGNLDINGPSILMGFSEEEIEKIDTLGRINTNGEKVIFLTFDDWGSDIAITKLLNVLRKHDVKASFFIRVGTDKMSLDDDMVNPNLLRAIALDGHDIGNHTFDHGKVDITKEEEVDELKKSIISAHEDMARYIGDTDSYKPYFRPPTLAISKLGLETIFHMGNTYIINGDFSTKDYMAPSLEFLVNTLKYGINTDNWEEGVNENTPAESIRKIEPGSVVVMHMSDESKYTPEALDIVIPYYKSKGYRFEKLSSYLK